MSWIKLTACSGDPVDINVEMCERVRKSDGNAPTNARCTIDLQSGNIQHVLESQADVMKLLRTLV